MDLIEAWSVLRALGSSSGDLCRPWEVPWRPAPPSVRCVATGALKTLRDQDRWASGRASVATLCARERADLRTPGVQ
ncbi:hypothetical protein HispidOSU_005121, partial [Sigmodon hispidus]